MKQKNEHLNHRVRELESTISSISQRTITKEEMNEMIKEELLPTLKSIEKEITYISKQTIEEENKEKIIRILKISVGYPLESVDTQTDEKDI